MDARLALPRQRPDVFHLPPALSDRSHSRLRCPTCHGRVKRVLRTEGDKRMHDADRLRRFRCRNGRCRWSGLLVVAERSRTPLRVTRRPALRRMAWVLGLVVVVAVVITAVVLALESLNEP